MREKLYMAWLLFPPITWLWNIRHRKLIEETKQIMRLHWFLTHDCGLKCADKLSAEELRELVRCLKRSRRNAD